MNEKFELVLVHFDGEADVTPRLYRRTYLVRGKPRTRYSGVFTDWQGKRRKYALGKDLKRAIQKIHDLDKKNHAEVDFDEQKQKREAREDVLEVRRAVPGVDEDAVNVAPEAP